MMRLYGFDVPNRLLFEVVADFLTPIFHYGMVTGIRRERAKRRGEAWE